MKITHQLNIVHSIHLSLLFTFFFVIHFFILREINNDNLLRQARQRAILIEQIIEQQYQQEAILRPMNASAETNYSFRKLVDFQFLDSIQIDAPFSFMILGGGDTLIYHFDTTKYANQEFFNSKYLQQAKVQNSIKKTFLFLNDDTTYLAAFQHLQFPGMYAIVYHPRATLLRSLGNYPVIISILFIIALMLMLMMVMRTNYKYTHSITGIVKNLLNNNHLQSKTGLQVDEAITIQRYIDSIQNQLEFYVKNLEKSKSEHMKFDKDMEIARKLQSNILPQRVPEIMSRTDFSIDAISEAAFELGGDFYDYFLLDHQHLVFVIGDIAGKGIPASLYMIFTHTLLRSIVASGFSVAEIAGNLNKRLIEESVSDLFITMIIGVMDTKDGTIEYCNAAHNYPLVIRSNGEIEELTDTHGIPLGIYSNKEFSSSKIQLSHNDQLFLYTDGLVDVKDENNMSFSVDVLKYNLMGAWFMEPEQVISKIQHDVKVFRGNVDPADDLTMLMLKYHQRG
ncbi:MAG: serine/threonine-protein phosphatase [Prolixibacteraceae bacterium]|nr:serine/threonine-protein phosphatase [Prolixibacteraceae bacterium]